MTRSTIALLLLGPVVVSGCREACTSNEVRYGDRCVTRPDAGAPLDADAGDVEDDQADGEMDAAASVPDNETAPPSDDSPFDSAMEPNNLEQDASGDASDDTGATCLLNSSGCGCDAGSSGWPSCGPDPCVPKPCKHGGTCTHSATGFACTCTGTGYTGTLCDVDPVNECASTTDCSDPTYPCVETEPPGYTCRGQLADWHMPGSPSTASKFAFDYDTGTPGVVIDRVTGLVWQRAIDPGTYSWADAQTYCSSLDLGQQTDWRLPTQIELISILDDSRFEPAIDPQAFPETSPSGFWTASVDTSDATRAVHIDFGRGVMATAVRSTGFHVRCLRQPVVSRGRPRDRYTATADTVTDTRTGLVWQRSPSTSTRSWTEAQTYCENLGNGFRLPTVKELSTLVDPTRDPPLDMSVFTSSPNYAWSSSTFKQDIYAWVVAINGGGGRFYQVPNGTPDQARALCVH